jgi:hypothetical protein
MANAATGGGVWLVAVIASAAKQSIFPATFRKDGLLRCARNDDFTREQA